MTFKRTKWIMEKKYMNINGLNIDYMTLEIGIDIYYSKELKRSALLTCAFDTILIVDKIQY